MRLPALAASRFRDPAVDRPNQTCVDGDFGHFHVTTKIGFEGN